MRSSEGEQGPYTAKVEISKFSVPTIFLEIGNNPDLCEMPADTFKTGKYDDVFVAIKSLQ